MGSGTVREREGDSEATGVSVGIVTWNSASVVGEALRAIESDEACGAPIAEICVVDNGSVDGTPDLVEREFPRARVIRNARNEGFARAANQLIRETAGSHVLLLNPDCRVRPGYVASLFDALEARGACFGFAGGKLLSPRREGVEEDRIDSAGLELTAALRVRDRGQGVADRGRYDAEEEVFGVCAAAALYRRNFLDDVAFRRDGASQPEFFDEEFGSYKEDADLCWRASKLGWRGLYVPEAVADHQRGFARARRADVPRWIRVQSFRNRYLLLLKNARLRDVVLRLPFLLGFEIAALMYALVKDRALLAAYPAVVGRMRRVRETRDGVGFRVADEEGGAIAGGSVGQRSAARGQRAFASRESFPGVVTAGASLRRESDVRGNDAD